MASKRNELIKMFKEIEKNPRIKDSIRLGFRFDTNINIESIIPNLARCLKDYFKSK